MHGCEFLKGGLDGLAIIVYYTAVYMPPKMARLCLESRRRVVLLNKQGYSVREIQARLHEEGIVVSLVTLYKLLPREKET